MSDVQSTSQINKLKIVEIDSEKLKQRSPPKRESNLEGYLK